MGIGSSSSPVHHGHLNHATSRNTYAAHVAPTLAATVSVASQLTRMTKYKRVAPAIKVFGKEACSLPRAYASFGVAFV